jgi:hypothetical protein
MVNHMTGQTLTKQVLNKDTDDKEIMEAEVPLDRTSVIQLLT